MNSIWNYFSSPQSFPSLSGNTKVDVAVIGAGVTGITTALLLSRCGFKVAVLESYKVGGGTTGHSTGNLYFTVDKNLSKLYNQYDTEIVNQVVSSRLSALDQIEEWVQEFGLDCDFHRQAWYLYSAAESENDRIEKEYENIIKAGIDGDWVDTEELPLHAKKAIKVDRQAQLNPRRYAETLAAAVDAPIYENTRVTSIEEDEGQIKLTTTGGTVTADYAIHATHIPKGVLPAQMAMSMYREYGVAYKVNTTDFPSGIFWGYHESGKFSTRLYERKEEKYVMIIGSPHRVGQAENNRDYINDIEVFAEKNYGFTGPEFRWGGQNYQPVDSLPFIGRRGGDSNVFIATGFATDGLIYGTLAGMIIADELNGKKNAWSKIYKAHRFRPLKSAKELVEEGVNTIWQYRRNIPGIAEDKEFQNISPGEGVVVEKNGKKIAVSRSEEGILQLCSAVCTHLKCIVRWNNLEKTWDCPCHASRFKGDGSVIEGPALNPLPKVDLEE